MTDRQDTRRSDAARNRARILDAARDAFADASGEVSMIEIARRSGVGSATLYRNFASRQELLEALYMHEVDDICAAASTVAGGTPGERLTAWLRRFVDYVTSKHPLAVELLEHTTRTDPVFGTSRDRVLAAGEPLLLAAREAHQAPADLGVDHILDLVVAVTKIPGTPEYREPIIRAVFAGVTDPGGRDAASA